GPALAEAAAANRSGSQAPRWESVTDTRTVTLTWPSTTHELTFALLRAATSTATAQGAGPPRPTRPAMRTRAAASALRSAAARACAALCAADETMPAASPNSSTTTQAPAVRTLAEPRSPSAGLLMDPPSGPLPAPTSGRGEQRRPAPP